MKFIADLHIHSRFSRATSQENNIFSLYKYSLIKGINLLGTGDFTHPGWYKELEDFLIEDGNGLLDLKEEYRNEISKEFPHLKNKSMKFIFSVEISSIYKKNDKVRKVHNLILMPDFKSVKAFNEKLGSMGNIRSDGRPILGLDSKTLLELALEINPKTMFIPAHIWTPWFSLFGMKSGFDTLEECFNDLSKEIFAVETGLSSDPAMNWRLKALDNLNLVSNSDAHSPDNLAREANIFDTELNYYKIRDALKNKKSSEFLGTIEFFPEEGKYHYDGHRNCDCRLTPKEAIKNKLLCPVCGKMITVGVLHRVEELADRDEGFRPEGAKDFKSLIPLKEIIGDAFGVNKKTKKVLAFYNKLLTALDNELFILEKAPIEEIKKHSTEIIAEGIKRVRENKVKILPGYDGDYGKITIFSEEDRMKNVSQSLLMSIELDKKKAKSPKKSAEPVKKSNKKIKLDRAVSKTETKQEINSEQEKAIQEMKGPVIVMAGPGTGKTFTLVQKITYLIQEREFSSENLLAITFTNKAAKEIRERLEQQNIHDTHISTFHGLALNILQQNNFNREIFDEHDCCLIIKEACRELNVNLNARNIYNRICHIKGNMENIEKEPDEIQRVLEIYQAKLDYYMGMDYEDIIIYCYKLLKKFPDILNKYKDIYKFILVDEFQDINYSEYQLVKLLSDEGKNLFVIGDPDQSIYKFRGANPELMFKLMDDFLYHKKMVLKKNYRNPEFFIKAGIDVIKSESRVLKKYDDIDILIKSDVQIEVIKTPTQLSAGIQIAKTITDYVGGTNMVDADILGAGQDLTFKDFAVLVRNTSQIANIEETLLHEGIPYKIVGNKSILDNKFIRLGINILRLKTEAFNNFRFFNIIETGLFGIPDKIIKDLKKKLSEDPDIDILQEVKKQCSKVKDENYKRLLQLLDSKIDKETLVSSFIKRFPFTFFKEKDCTVFHNLANQYGAIKELLKVVLIGNEQDIEMDRENLNKLKDIERISILTIHSAKGLEFPILFLYEAVEGLMPYVEKNADINEERRLFYVGLTRAKEKLFIVIPKKIKRYGSVIKTEDSRFVKEISSDFINVNEIKFDPKAEADKDQLKLF